MSFQPWLEAAVRVLGEDYRQMLGAAKHMPPRLRDWWTSTMGFIVA